VTGEPGSMLRQFGAQGGVIALARPPRKLNRHMGRVFGRERRGGRCRCRQFCMTLIIDRVVPLSVMNITAKV
jgi:hypothetical protein